MVDLEKLRLAVGVDEQIEAKQLKARKGVGVRRGAAGGVGVREVRLHRDQCLWRGEERAIESERDGGGGG